MSYELDLLDVSVGSSVGKTEQYDVTDARRHPRREPQHRARAQKGLHTEARKPNPNIDTVFQEGGKDFVIVRTKAHG